MLLELKEQKPYALNTRFLLKLLDLPLILNEIFGPLNLIYTHFSPKFQPYISFPIPKL